VVPDNNPEIVMLKLPVPVPLVVFVGRSIVGFWLVLQQTPLELTAEPPSLVIFPPVIAELVVTVEIALVVITAKD
jgi:hypothetical protein